MTAGRARRHPGARWRIPDAAASLAGGLRRVCLHWRTAVAVAVCAAGALIAPAPAQAHTGLEVSLPADGATVSSLPAPVRLRFTDDIVPGTAAAALTGPRGAVDLAAPSALGRDVRMTLPPVLNPGRYRLAWRVVAEDGHAVRGMLTFVLAPVAATSTPAAGEPLTARATAPAAPAAPEPWAATAAAASRDLRRADGSGATAQRPAVHWAGFALLLLLAAAAPRLLAHQRTGSTTGSRE
ncbi:MAG: copper resistance CopC family protein [Dermatophilaceae bacterium]